MPFHGSSPRMRGTPCAFPAVTRCHRFIPAHAGNTARPRLQGFVGAVHPRACGEHSRLTDTERSTHGSSPRMRGTLLRDDGTLWLNRFIPAHAGNTPCSRPSPFPSSVHPRACGEHVKPLALAFLIAGSSPRMRGTRSASVYSVLDHRFIPAHAGNTLVAWIRVSNYRLCDNPLSQ